MGTGTENCCSGTTARLTQVTSASSQRAYAEAQAKMVSMPSAGGQPLGAPPSLALSASQQMRPAAAPALQSYQGIAPDTALRKVAQPEKQSERTLNEAGRDVLRNTARESQQIQNSQASQRFFQSHLNPSDVADHRLRSNSSSSPDASFRSQTDVSKVSPETARFSESSQTHSQSGLQGFASQCEILKTSANHLGTSASLLSLFQPSQNLGVPDPALRGFLPRPLGGAVVTGGMVLGNLGSALNGVKGLSSGVAAFVAMQSTRVLPQHSQGLMPGALGFRNLPTPVFPQTQPAPPLPNLLQRMEKRLLSASQILSGAYLQAEHSPSPKSSDLDHTQTSLLATWWQARLTKRRLRRLQKKNLKESREESFEADANGEDASNGLMNTLIAASAC